MKKSLPLINFHKALVNPLREFFNDSRAVGVVLILCTILSMTFSNLGATQQAYTGFWEKEFHLNLGFLHLPHNPLEWVNDVLMTLFFLVVGMEIKRELTIGELASVKKSMLPILAALGGMVVPALIYAFVNNNSPYHHGWGIPMATDIAFSLAVLSLLGKRVPVQLKIFLTALAIIDDLGAVLTIAIFYTAKIHFWYLLGGAAAFGSVMLMNRFQIKNVFWYAIPGIILWYCLFNSGVHATIAGVLMAFAMPLNKLETLEHRLLDPVNFLIMPLFALANTAIILPSDITGAIGSEVSKGVMLGLFIGKPVGIFLFSFLAIKARVAALPSRTSFRQLFGVGMLGGIGFTMSIFTTGLAFSEVSIQIVSKVAIIVASLLSGIGGYVYLYVLKPAKQVSVDEAEEKSLREAGLLPEAVVA